MKEPNDNETVVVQQKACRAIAQANKPHEPLPGNLLEK